MGEVKTNACSHGVGIRALNLCGPGNLCIHMDFFHQHALQAQQLLTGGLWNGRMFTIAAHSLKLINYGRARSTCDLWCGVNAILDLLLIKYMLTGVVGISGRPPPRHQSGMLESTPKPQPRMG